MILHQMNNCGPTMGLQSVCRETVAPYLRETPYGKYRPPLNKAGHHSQWNEWMPLEGDLSYERKPRGQIQEDYHLPGFDLHSPVLCITSAWHVDGENLAMPMYCK